MFLTVFLSIVVCGSVSIMMVSGIAFIQDIKMFSSAPKEARDVLIPRDRELFYGARTIGWVLMLFSFAMILGSLAVALWDGLRNGFTFQQFFTRFVIIFSAYKVYDMIFFDYFLLMRYHFFPVSNADPLKPSHFASFLFINIPSVVSIRRTSS